MGFGLSALPLELFAEKGFLGSQASRPLHSYFCSWLNLTLSHFL